MEDPKSLGFSFPRFQVCIWRILGFYRPHQLQPLQSHSPALLPLLTALPLQFLDFPPWPSLPIFPAFPISAAPTAFPAVPHFCSLCCPHHVPTTPILVPILTSYLPALYQMPVRPRLQWELTGGQGPTAGGNPDSTVLT